MILIPLSVAWMVGIYVSSQLDVPLVLWGLASLFPLSVALLWRQTPRVSRAALCGLFVFLGAGRFRLALPRFDQTSVSFYNDRGEVRLVGVVTAEPDVRDRYVYLRLGAETLTLADGQEVEVEGRVLLRVARYPEYRYGDRLEVRGVLSTPPEYADFSYRDYLARQGIYSWVTKGEVVLSDRGQGNPLIALALALKRHVEGVIAQILPEPCAALLTGILLGVEGGIPADLMDDFRVTGTSHIIAISGFNLAIIAGFFSALGVRLVGRRYAAWFATAAVVIYTLFVGASAAVVRAAVMGCIAVWGEHFGRQYSAKNALWTTALLMTAWNPHTLWDVGFQLSFAASLGLILLGDPFQRGFGKLLSGLLPEPWAGRVSEPLNESLVLTLCAQLMTLPIMLRLSPELSPLTLLSNVLILPPQPQVMLWGAVAALGGVIWLPLGRVLGWVAWLFLAYTIWIVQMMARIQGMTVDMGRIGPLFTWSWYAALGGTAWWIEQNAERRRAILGAIWQALTQRLPAKALVGALAVAAILVWAAVAALPDGRLHVVVLDVDSGSAVWIETPEGQQILINGGPSPARLMAHLGRRMPFWDRSLDVLVLTDASKSHLSGLIPVVERYTVGWVLDAVYECDSSECRAWQAALQQRGWSVQHPIAGTRIDMGEGVLLTVLYPPGDRDEGPMVLRLEYGSTCFLLAGGAGEQVQATLVGDRAEMRCEVLHLERTAGNLDFLEAVNPGLVILSEDDGDSYPLALEEWIRRGAQVRYTGAVGSVEVISDGHSCRLERSR